MPRLPVAVVVAVLVFVAPARAFGQETLDQDYHPSGGTGDAIGARFAQTFTAGRAGKLTAVRLWGRPRNGSGVTVEITGLKADGSPDEVPLASARTGDAYPLVRFATPLWVVPGKKYAIVFDADDTWDFDCSRATRTRAARRGSAATAAGRSRSRTSSSRPTSTCSRTPGRRTP